ncbi:hypothetical protein DXG03_001150 [Asterophora parasitica]|uniref:Uncharacterized protein n=1 Tax=Asterophora parasitica TaxID=117018 RepID=A0A9P7KGU9_9AGAR|nr:hypothetical protein DXG03_001150 [Asterophora parasitica]
MENLDLELEGWYISKEEELTAETELINESLAKLGTTFLAIKYLPSDLRALGWDEEVAVHEEWLSDDIWNVTDALSEHKLVKQPRELTDRRVIEFMENVKAERLDRELRAAIKKRSEVLSEILKNYASSLPLHFVLPPLADIASVASFRAVIEDTPVEEDVLEAHFDEPMLSFPEIVDTWRDDKNAELVEMMRACDEIETEVSSSSLRLATSLFRSSRCAFAMAYQVLVHTCFTAILGWEEPGPYYDNIGCRPWNSGEIVRVSFDNQAYIRARLVLRDGGFGHRHTHL